VSAPKVDPIAAGAEIAKHLWSLRRGTKADRALTWSRSREVVNRAGDARDVGPSELFAMTASESGASSPIAGVLEKVGRDLRFALSYFNKPKGLAYEPKPDDVFCALLEAERRVDAAVEMVGNETDAAVWAIHAAANGAFPDGAHDPTAIEPRETAIERVGRLLGADVRDVEAAAAAWRAWGIDGRAMTDDAARWLLEEVRRLRTSLESESCGAGVPMGEA
jgi:hypothetical protein